MIDIKDILFRLRTLRKQKELRQEYVARRLGVDRTTYVRKEQGAIPITTEEWLKLAEAMEKEPAYFFSLSSAAVKRPRPVVRERLLVKLYRSLKPEEKEAFVSGLQPLLKSVRRETVKRTLKRLVKV